MKNDISQQLRPYPKLFSRTSNSIQGHILSAGPIICGIALAGSVIPFFMNTTIPWLLWLSNPGVLIPLVLVSAVIWAAIYGAEIRSILLGMFWDQEFKGKDKDIKVNETYSVLAKYINMSKSSENQNDTTLELVRCYYISELKQNFKDNEIYQKFDAKIKTLEKYLKHRRSDKILTYSENQMIDFIRHINANTNQASFQGILDNYKTYEIDPALPDDVKDELFKLMVLNRKYPIQKTKQVFDILGWLNAFLVNSVGVAISGLSIAAFISQLLFNYGLTSSANLYAPIAYTVVITCFAAGAIAASVLTRLRTKSVGEDMSVSFYNWIESKNKLKIFSPKNSVTFLAIIISLTVAIGFAGFNYYTGYYFGSMLVELWFGNPANLVNPAYILDARNSVSGLGIAFALIGFSFTILSTSSFLYEVVYNAINKLKKTINSFFTDLHKDNTWIYKFGGYTLLTADIVAIAMVINSAVFASSQVLLITTLTIATVCLSLSIVLYINNPKESQANINSYVGYGVALTMIFVMAFACAATAAIGTAKVGSFWYTYLPSMLATTPLLQTYGMIVFIAAMIAFPAVFGTAFADIYSKFQEWLNPTPEPAIFNADEYKPRTTIELTLLSKEGGKQVLKGTDVEDMIRSAEMIDVPLGDNDSSETDAIEPPVSNDTSSEQEDDIIAKMATRELAIML